MSICRHDKVRYESLDSIITDRSFIAHILKTIPYCHRTLSLMFHALHLHENNAFYGYTLDHTSLELVSRHQLSLPFLA